MTDILSVAEQVREEARRDRRSQFAMRAPHEIPTWFEPAMPPRPKVLPPPLESTFVDSFPEPVRKAARDAMFYFREGMLSIDYEAEDVVQQQEQAVADIIAASPGWNLVSKDELITGKDIIARFRAQLEAEDARDVSKRAAREWGDERNRQRIAQWPWAWADLVLEAEGVRR